MAATARRKRMERRARQVRRDLDDSFDDAHNLCEQDREIVASVVSRCDECQPITPEDVMLAFDAETPVGWDPDDPQAIICAACDFLPVSAEDCMS